MGPIRVLIALPFVALYGLIRGLDAPMPRWLRRLAGTPEEETRPAMPERTEPITLTRAEWRAVHQSLCPEHQHELRDSIAYKVIYRTLRAGAKENSLTLVFTPDEAAQILRQVARLRAAREACRR